MSMKDFTPHLMNFTVVFPRITTPTLGSLTLKREVIKDLLCENVNMIEVFCKFLSKSYLEGE